MKKVIKILLGFVILLLIILVIAVIFTNNGGKKLLVVEVKNNALYTMGLDAPKALYIVKLKNQDVSMFNKGQEIFAYYDGIIDTIFPGSFTADKVKVLKEKSDKEIPIEVLRYYNYSMDNIYIEIGEFTNLSINFSITDSNKYPLDYGDEFSYIIQKKNLANIAHNHLLTEEFKSTINRNVIQTEDGVAISPSGENPNTNKYKSEWEELNIIGDESFKNQLWEIKETNKLMLKGFCNWTGLYGELENQGEYRLIIYRKNSVNDDFFSAISIKFVIDENGNINYEEPELEW